MDVPKYILEILALLSVPNPDVKSILEQFQTQLLNDTVLSSYRGAFGPLDKQGPLELTGMLRLCYGLPQETEPLGEMWSNPTTPSLSRNITPKKRTRREVFTPDDRIPDDGPNSVRNYRGLKILSKKVKEIVEHGNNLSYKDVADTLINSISEDISIKEEKNIRRRVYDALNVLISANVFQKVGRVVSLMPVIEHRPKTPDEQNTIKRISSKIVQKKDKLGESVKKLTSIKSLINRNKKLPLPEDKLQFPFIIISTLDDKSNTLSIKVNQERSAVRMHFSKEFTLFGEVEALGRLEGIPKVRNGIPKEIAKYMENENLKLNHQAKVVIEIYFISLMKKVVSTDRLKGIIDRLKLTPNRLDFLYKRIHDPKSANETPQTFVNKVIRYVSPRQERNDRSLPSLRINSYEVVAQQHIPQDQLSSRSKASPIRLRREERSQRTSISHQRQSSSPRITKTNLTSLATNIGPQRRYHTPMPRRAGYFYTHNSKDAEMPSSIKIRRLESFRRRPTMLEKPNEVKKLIVIKKRKTRRPIRDLSLFPPFEDNDDISAW